MAFFSFIIHRSGAEWVGLTPEHLLGDHSNSRHVIIDSIGSESIYGEELHSKQRINTLLKRQLGLFHAHVIVGCFDIGLGSRRRMIENRQSPKPNGKYHHMHHLDTVDQSSPLRSDYNVAGRLFGDTATSEKCRCAQESFISAS